MTSRFVIRFDPQAEALLRGAGLDRCDTPPNLGFRQPLSRPGPGPALHRLPALTDGQIPILKRIPCTSPARARRIVRGERILRRCADSRGLPVLLPAAWGADLSVPGEGIAFLLFLAAPESMPLDRLSSGGSGWRRRVLEVVVEELARWHAAGFRLPGLAAWTILVEPGGELSLLDPAPRRSRLQGRGLAWRAQLRDLAALSATLDAETVPTARRLGLLRRYLARRFPDGGRASRWRGPWARITRTERRLRRRGLLPLRFDLVENGPSTSRLYTTQDCSAALVRHGFRTAAEFADPERLGARLLRRKESRRNAVLDTAQGRFFFKVHEKSARFRGSSEGIREWRGYHALARFGVATPPPAACGWHGSTSFFVSFDEGGAPLDDVIRDERQGGARGADEARKHHALTRDLGRLVARFHRCGFFHHDLYLCHVLCTAGLRLTLIDLQRLDEGGLRQRHGRVKDLAALLYSSLEIPITASDRLRFLATYRGGASLDHTGRRLIEKVERKARRIAAHVRRRAARSVRGDREGSA